MYKINKQQATGNEQHQQCNNYEQKTQKLLNKRFRNKKKTTAAQLLKRALWTIKNEKRKNFEEKKKWTK